MKRKHRPACTAPAATTASVRGWGCDAATVYRIRYRGGCRPDELVGADVVERVRSGRELVLLRLVDIAGWRAEITVRRLPAADVAALDPVGP